MDITKQNEIRQQVAKMTNDVLQGNTNPLDAFIFIKKMEEVLKQVKDNIKDVAIDEAARHGGKTFAFGDAKVTLKSSAGRWNYKHIQSIIDKAAELKELQELHKSAANNKGATIVDSDGVIIEPAIYTDGKETISITIKK